MRVERRLVVILSSWEVDTWPLEPYVDVADWWPEMDKVVFGNQYNKIVGIIFIRRLLVID